MAHLILDLEWPLIVEQVRIEEFERHERIVIHAPTIDYTRVAVRDPLTDWLRAASGAMMAP